MAHPTEADWPAEALLNELIEFLDGDQPRWDAICCRIAEVVPYCDWVGFYWCDPIRPRLLILGDYVGEPTEHVEIPFGRGICGQVAESLQTYVTADVSRESNYLACSPKVRSEIVVPIVKDGKLRGQLDIDSHTPAAFSDRHRHFFEALCRAIEAKIQ